MWECLHVRVRTGVYTCSCVGVCTCVCVAVCTYVYGCVSTCVYVWECVHVCGSVCGTIYMCVWCVGVYTYVCGSVYVCAHVCTFHNGKRWVGRRGPLREPLSLVCFLFLQEHLCDYSRGPPQLTLVSSRKTSPNLCRPEYRVPGDLLQSRRPLKISNFPFSKYCLSRGKPILDGEDMVPLEGWDLELRRTEVHSPCPHPQPLTRQGHQGTEGDRGSVCSGRARRTTEATRGARRTDK